MNEPGETVYLALGSNLGDREAHLQAAVQALRQVPGVSVLRRSSVVETPALLANADAPAQPAYLNQVIELTCTLSAQALLVAVRSIEAVEGRVRRERWSSRTLDIDILLYGAHVIDTPELTVPHPEMTRRSFVLGPLRELAAERVHPSSGQTIEQLWNHLKV